MKCYSLFNGIFLLLLLTLSVITCFYTLLTSTNLWSCHLWYIFLLNIIFYLVYIVITCFNFLGKKTIFYYEDKLSFYGIVLLYLTLLGIGSNILGYVSILKNYFDNCDSCLSNNNFILTFYINCLAPLFFIFSFGIYRIFKKEETLPTNYIEFE